MNSKYSNIKNIENNKHDILRNIPIIPYIVRNTLFATDPIYIL